MHFDYSQYKQKGFTPIVIILGILLIAGIAGGAHYLGKSSSFPQIQPIIQSVPTVTIQPSPTADETVNWKTFTNNIVGYTLKYPSDWEFVGKSEGCGPVFYMSGTEKIWLTVCGPYVDKDDDPESIAERTAINKQILSREDVQVDGHHAVRQELKISNQITAIEIEIYVANVQKGTLGVYFYIHDLTKLEEAKGSLEKILSTFKFTN